MTTSPERALVDFTRSVPKEQREQLGPYLNYLRSVPLRRDWKPFFIEIVDSNGKLTEIPWPQSTSGGRILGVKLLINPTSLTVNMAKIVGRTQAMTGWIEEHWGEELDTVTFQGSTAAFVTGSPRLKDARKAAERINVNKAQVRGDFYSYLGLYHTSVPYQTSVEGSKARSIMDTEPGLTTRFRNQSLSYREFSQVVKIFASNGCVFGEDGLVEDRKFIRLSYDYSSYIGYFESVDVTEEAVTPFKFTYTITYKAEKTAYSFVTRGKVNAQAAG